MKRFIHLVAGLNRLGGGMRTKYNQYHTAVVPMVRYLTDKGLDFRKNTQVTDINFNLSADHKTATVLHVINRSGTTSEVVIGDNTIYS